MLGRNYEMVLEALTDFNRLNHQHRYCNRCNQCQYESSIVGKLAMASKLFYTYIRKRKKSCSLAGASEMSELLGDAFLAVFV